MKISGTIVTTIVEYVEAEVEGDYKFPSKELFEIFEKVVLTLSTERVLVCKGSQFIVHQPAPTIEEIAENAVKRAHSQSVAPNVRQEG